MICRTALKGPAPCVPSQLRLVGVRTSYSFLIFPGHPEFWTLLQILIWGPPGCTLLRIPPFRYTMNIKDNGQRSHLLVGTSGWTRLSSYLPLGQGFPERVVGGSSIGGILPVRGRTLQNPGQLDVAGKCTLLQKKTCLTS